MTDIKWEIIRYLVDEKEPRLAHHIAKALKKSQSHIDYHLKQLIKRGRVLCYTDEDGNKTYTVQLFLISERVRDDFYEMLLGSLPKALVYMDLRRCDDDTKAVISTYQDFIRLMAKELEKELRNSRT